jgi:hypothetical protein
MRTLFLFVSMLLFSAETPKLSQPTPEEMKKAEENIGEILKKRYPKVDSPVMHEASAIYLLEKADQFAADPANLFVLLDSVRKHSLEADDTLLAMKSIEKMAARFEDPQKNDPKELVELGDQYWGLADLKKGRESLELRADALRLYLWANGAADESDRIILGKRREEFIENAFDRKFLSADAVVRLFDLGTKVWSKKDDVLSANLAAGKPGVFMKKIPIASSRCEFGFKIKSKWHHRIDAEVNGMKFLFSIGHWNNSGLMIFDGEEGKETVRRNPGPKVEKPDAFHAMRVRIEGKDIQFFYDHEIIWQKTLNKPAKNTRKGILVGFGSHETEIQIKDVYLTQ